MSNISWNSEETIDQFPLAYDDRESSSNQTFYDDFLFAISNRTTSNSSSSVDLPSIFSPSSPFAYIIFILIVYLILTFVLLTFSLYKQRQHDLANFDDGETDEEIEQSKRTLAWKQLLIGKISKGDMEPLLFSTVEDNPSTFPLHLV